MSLSSGSISVGSNSVHAKADIPFDINDVSLWVDREMGSNVIVRNWFSQLVARFFGVVHCVRCNDSQVLYLDMNQVRAWRERSRALVLEAERVAHEKSTPFNVKTVAATTRAQRKEISRLILTQKQGLDALNRIYPPEYRTSQSHFETEIRIENARAEINAVVKAATNCGYFSAKISPELDTLLRIVNISITPKALIEGLELKKQDPAAPQLIKDIKALQERFAPAGFWEGW